MQTTQPISLEQLHEIVSAVFAQGPVVVKQAYSDFDCATRVFADVKAMIEDLKFEPGDRDVFRHYTIYYPEAKGRTYERRIALKPESCDGHTFRFCQEGWGLIQLQCDFRELPTIDRPARLDILSSFSTGGGPKPGRRQAESTLGGTDLQVRIRG